MRSGLFFFTIGLPVIGSILLTACPGNDGNDPPPPVCTDGGVTSTCTPAYEPTYDQIFANTFKPTCAKSGVSCHASTGKQGGLDFDDLEGAYIALQRNNIVVPGRPECSTLVHRLVATDGKVRMPPGRSIEQNEQCTIIQWIANGAPRR